MSWIIIIIFVYHMDIIKWRGEIFYHIIEYFAMSHLWFFSKMNNGLLTLNMGLAKKAINNNIVWMIENVLANWRVHFIIPRATNASNV
jgi:hypothetical protein